mmetsp:Transcript_36207/g.36433  ORF Transcript_36207/g.36433 Transcript_36207/m.36433 type:complete len:97 (-) Transcript_36207:73-363(-)
MAVYKNSPHPSCALNFNREDLTHRILLDMVKRCAGGQKDGELEQSKSFMIKRDSEKAKPNGSGGTEELSQSAILNLILTSKAKSMRRQGASPGKPT